MNILVTGAAGFVGRNLVESLKTLRDGKNPTRPGLSVGEIYEYDRENTPEQLDAWCAGADFVFHFAGVNRPGDPVEYKTGNVGFTSELLQTLRRHDNRCPVVLSSSIQASLAGRFGASEYGLSKRECEALCFDHARATGAGVCVYRFPNIVGKWTRPNYNSAVGTFCHNIARDLPVTVHDPDTELELLFVDDLIEEMYDALEGHPHRCEYPAGEDGRDSLVPSPAPDGRYCFAPVTHRTTLGAIVACLRGFRAQPETLLMPAIAPGSLEKKLYSMYLSYLPAERAIFDLRMNTDNRGSFTELIRTHDHGQFSVNISKPGVTKGQHWHNSKWELFIVVSGHGLIRERRLGTGEVTEYEVSGQRLQAVYMLPGSTHSITNLSTTEDLVTLMWANEPFDPERPDTFAEPV
ncbi:MAG: NAD-dependent epimerase/dehydratase family protein [Clostridia bacterium]|nr:NAD-dependent epimerase/dehydratase family protein [Clostridia bacterium]